MHTIFPIGVNSGWGRLVTALVVGVGVSWAAAATLVAPWAVLVTVVIGLPLLAVIVVSWRGGALSNLVWGRVFRRRLGGTTTPPGSTIDHRLGGSTDAVAIRADGRDLIAVVAVDGPSHSPSVLDHHQVQSASTLPVGVVAAALEQFDVALAGIDILSVGRRRAAAAHHPYSDTYTAVVGDHAAVGRRRTWCVLRLNAFDNAAAVAARDSVAATLAACAHRLAAELTAQRCPARVVDSAELADIDTAVLLGVDSAARCGWGGLLTATATVASYAVSPADISTATLDRLWSPDTDATATTVQLRRTGGATRVGVLVRYATAGAQLEPPLTGLNPLAGRHDLGLRAGLVLPAPPPVLAPQRTLEAAEDLRAPIGSTGIILGSTASGHPLLLPLESADPAGAVSVTVAGELALLMQIAQRCAAAGMRVAVLTTRPAPWREVAAPGLRILDRVPAELPDGGRGVLLVYDRPSAGAHPHAAVTLRVVQRDSASVSDVHLEQDSASTAVIRTNDFSYRLSVDLRTERAQVSAAMRRAA